ncbi:MAG: phage tail protein [Vallitalea sp.]|jgi:hypothetical protein|nr:phage tail protein [Vallitalea sp.]
MIKVNSLDIAIVEQKLGSFKNKAPTAISRALNRAAANAKTNTSKKVREGYNIKAKTIRETIDVNKANKNKLRSSVKSKGEKVSLSKFKVSPANPRPTRPPKVLKVSVKKDTGLKEILGAFVANINGNKVFERTTKSRLPIKQLYGPAVPQMLGNEVVRKSIEEEARKTYLTRLEHEINRVLEKSK